MDAEQGELYWKWGVRGGLALLLLLANVLLVVVIFNASDAFGAVDRVGEAADALEATAGTLDVAASELIDDVERITDTIEQAGDDVSGATDVLDEAGRDVKRATDALERAANDFERIADALEEAFAQ